MVFSMNRILRHVLQRVVHPAHVPLEPKAQAPHIGGPGDHRPGGGLFRDGLDIRIVGIDLLVEVAQKSDGFQVLSPAVLVGNPFPFFSGVVQVQHGGDGVHPQSVDVVLVKPEEGTAEQEAPDFVPPVVEDEAAPVRVEPLLRIGVFVEVRPIEKAWSVLVGWKVGGDPVQDHANAMLMQVVNQVHEVLRSAVPAGRRKVACGLVAPGAVEGVLHNG